MGNTVMIVGSGAREHALARAYLKNPEVTKVLVTPGNQGMTLTKGIHITPGTNLKDRQSFLEVANHIEPILIDVAQDDALAAGTVDLLRENNYLAFGPTAEAAKIESDKLWSREFMEDAGIKIPEYHPFKQSDRNSIEYAQKLLQKHETVFFKAAGLYAGKGVIPATNETDLSDVLAQMQKMGPASETFLVEAGMVGEEFSYYVMPDGKNFVTFKSSQDNKRIGVRDEGPNTGGMGANAPALVTSGLEQQILSEIVNPFMEGMAKRGIEYKGILYLGGMVCEDGSLKVVEFNSRWGDPECHVILPGIETNYFSLVNAAMKGELKDQKVKEDNEARVCIIGASAGYPGPYDKGKQIWFDENNFPNRAQWLSAGIKLDEDKNMYTAGGRVFSVVGKGRNVVDARQMALEGMACFHIEDNGLVYRPDIAYRDIQRILKQN